MFDLQKFYADIQRCLKRCRAQQAAYDGLKTSKEAAALFASYCRDLGNLGDSLAAYWYDTYIAASSNPQEEPSRVHVDWLAAALSLLDGSMAADQDFPRRDWEEIRLLIDSEAEDIPLETLSAIMSIMVERKVL